MKKYLWFIFLLTVKLYSVNEPIHYSKLVEQITVLGSSNGYTKKIICKGQFLNKLDKTISIVANELENISKFKRINYLNNNIIDKGIEIFEHSISSTSFYDGLKEYIIQYTDTGITFGLQYEVSCKQLILLSDLPLGNYPNADTLVYEINTPLNYYLKLKRDTSNAYNLRIDTLLINKNIKKYIIVSIPKYKVKLKESYPSNYEINNQIPASLRVLLMPAGEYNEWQFFNNWFSNLIKDNVTLKVQSRQQLNSILNGDENEEEKIKKIFNFINTNIKYVDIENGLNAFRPRDVNSILYKKYGDCKDMANVLCQTLNYYKIEANIALIATINYRYQLDFPSLSSANHAICIAKTKTGKIFYLDATDKTGSYNLPSQFIQGRPYFAINTSGGERNTVPIINFLRNNITSSYTITEDNNSLKGEVKNEYSNYSGSEIRYMCRNLTNNDAKSSLTKNINLLNSNTKFSNIKTEIIDSIAKLNADVVISNVINKVGNKKYLLLKFLMFPHQYPKKIKEDFRFITYTTNNNHFFYEITLVNNIKITKNNKDYHFKNETMSFDFTIKTKENNKLIIEYTLIINKIELSKKEIIEYEKLNEEIIKIFNTSIEYEVNN